MALTYRRRQVRRGYGRRRRYGGPYRRVSKLKVPGQVFKIQQSFSLTTDLSGEIQHGFNLFKPDAGVDGSVLYPYVDWSNLVALYQNFSTIKICVEYIPKLPNDTGLSTFYLPYYMALDMDEGTTSPLTTIDEAISYPGVKLKNLYKPWKQVFKIRNNIINTNDVVVLMNGKPYHRSDTGCSRGVIRTFATGLDSSTTYGTINLSLYVNMRNRN